MSNVLPRVHMPPIVTSMMASLYGAVCTWDDSLSVSELFGYSGHAFILNIERALCPSGPTAWDWGAIFFPLRQMIHLKRICATCDMRDADEARELIWQRAIAAIDAGRPVVLWDAVLPEFYLAYGYDAERGDYLIHGPGAERVDGRAPYVGLGGRTAQVWGLFPSPHAQPDRAAARDLALRGAVAWHRWPNAPDSQWVFGGDAWEVWMAAMGDEELPHTSEYLSVSHHVYAECRRHAAAFLAGQDPLFAEAAEHYARVAQALEALCTAWPYPAPVPPASERRALVSYLATARDAEDAAIRALDAALTAAPLAIG